MANKFLWEHEYNIHLFIHHIKERPARVLRYVRSALKQLLGEEFSMEQYRLRKVLDLNLSCNTKTPQPYKPKPQKLHTNYKRQPAKPRSVFGKKYLEHYGYGCTEDMAQYYVEYKYYHEKGRCRWDCSFLFALSCNPAHHSSFFFFVSRLSML